MKDKTKKIVAGVVLGTFVFGATTPAFATEQLYEDNIYLSDQSITNNNISEENVPGTETYGVAKHIVQAVKKLLQIIGISFHCQIKQILFGINY